MKNKGRKDVRGKEYLICLILSNFELLCKQWVAVIFLDTLPGLQGR